MSAQDIEYWFGPEYTHRLHQHLEESTGLPNVAYVDESFLDMENQRILSRHWVLAGFVHDIANSGDVLPVAVADKPVLLVHGDDGEIRAFHNVCRHRGARLVDQPCKGAKLLRCPNHHWAYGLDGRFRNRPHYFGPEKHDTHRDGNGPIGLIPISCDTWHDMVFVNLSGDAGSLRDYLKPVTDRTAEYDLSALRYAGCLEWELNCNWKLVNENFIEPYHVFAVHPGLLKFGPMNTRRASEFEGLCFFNDYQFPEPDQNRGSGLPEFPKLPESKLNNVTWFHLFPSLTFEIFPSQMAVWQLQPLSAQTTLERVHVYLIGDAASGESYKEERQKVFDTWHGLNNEDIEIIERMQAGRSSPGFDGGVLSPYWDGAIQHYAKIFVEQMEK